MEQTSLKRIEAASRAECSRHKKIRLITMILAVSGTLFALTEYHRVQPADAPAGQPVTATFEGVFGIVLLCFAAALGFITVFSVFSDMTSKQDADVQMSLPMSAMERFCSKILAVAKLNLLPTVTGFALVVFLGTLFTGAWSSMDEPITVFWLIIDLDLFAMAMAVFCTVCCGAKAESRYTTVIGGLCLSFLPYAIYTLILNNYSGVSFYYGSETRKAFSFFGMMIVTLLDDTESLGDAAPYLLVNLLTSCALIFASYFIYRRRDARSVGKPMVYPLFMELFFIIGIFTLYTLFQQDTNELPICFVITLIICLVIRIIAARAKVTPKLFGIWIGKYLLTVIGFYAITFVGYITGGFGVYKYQPDVPKDYSNYRVKAIIYDTDSSRSYELTYEGTDISRIKAADSYIIKQHDISGRDLDSFMNYGSIRYYSYYYSDHPDPDGKYMVEYTVTGEKLIPRKNGDSFTQQERIYSKQFSTNTDIRAMREQLRGLGLEEDSEYNEEYLYDDSYYWSY